MPPLRWMPVPALAAALLAGCTSPADTPVAPEGFTRIEQGWIGVHVPEGLVDKPDKRAGKFDLVLEDDVEKPTLQLVIATDYAKGTASSPCSPSASRKWTYVVSQTSTEQSRATSSSA